MTDDLIIKIVTAIMEQAENDGGMVKDNLVQRTREVCCAELYRQASSATGVSIMGFVPPELYPLNVPVGGSFSITGRQRRMYGLGHTEIIPPPTYGEWRKECPIDRDCVIYTRVA